MMGKPILCLDFDGVIHSYSSGWKGADVIPDPPVRGAESFIRRAAERFDVQVYSSRSHQPGGIAAMSAWMRQHMGDAIESLVGWPDHKPSAMVTIDDRAIMFTGQWPTIAELLAFQPWTKGLKLGATGEFPDGKLGPADEGELRMAVAHDAAGLVHVDFGKPVKWFTLPPAQARALAKLLLTHAGDDFDWGALQQLRKASP